MSFVITIATVAIALEIVTSVEIIAPHNALNPIISQYLGQDGLGRYSYGYITPTSTKSETKDTNGIIKGGYSYLDPKGKLQSVHYVADPIHGFLVAASNLPQDVPSVAAAKQRHLEKFETIKAEHALIGLSKQNAEHQLSANPVHVVATDVPRDAPAVAYAKQKHLEKFEAIKAQHELLANAKNDPHAKILLSNPIHDLPAVARAKAQHLAAFEAIKARDLELKAAKAKEEVLVDGSYTPIIPAESIKTYTYGYVHPIVPHSAWSGYSYLNSDGILKTINYVNN